MKNFLLEAEFITGKYLSEAGLDYSKNKVGETNFTKTDGSEAHIQQIIQDYANAKGVKVAEAQTVFDDKIAEMKKNMEKSLKLNGTMLSNAAESAAFDMLEQIPMADIKFDKRIFQNLFQEVKSEVPEFYPLSNSFEPKRIEPTIWYAPDKLAPEFNGIGTAACTPDAKLIFNVPFMEKLMKFATIKGIKADGQKLHGKKYASQGGNIPDAYLYCEFVLLHEIMHYGNGDFYFEKAYNLNGTLVNYTGDFITNYNLVKSGYAQLPIGLFNDDINYDRYNSYQQMYDVIEEEMNKLSPKDKKNMQDQMDKMGDEMPKEGQGSDPNQSPEQQQQQGQQGKPDQQGQKGEGEGKGGEGEGKEGDQQGQPGQGQGGGKPGDQQDGEQGKGQGGGKPGDQKDGDEEGDGSGSGDKKSDKKDGKGTGSGKETAEEKAEQKKREADAKADMANQEERAKKSAQDEKDGKTAGTNSMDGKPKGQVPKSVDDAMRDNASTLENAQKQKDRETKTGMNQDAMKPGAIADMMSGANNGTGKNSADGNPYALDEKQYKPKLNWKAMLKKMVPSGSQKTETYAKPSRRTTSTMVTIAQTGAGVVKPGMKEEDDDKKGLCFVLDNSGSTMGKIGAMQDDILSLMKKHGKQINDEMYVMKFSNDVHYFKVDVKKKKYGKITDIEEFTNTGKSSVKCDQPVAALFKSTYGGGTELTSKITMAVKTLFGSKFNVIMFSDSDIVGGQNSTQLKQIYIAGKQQFALIGCDKNDYKAYVDLLGNKNNITYYA